MGDGAAVLLTGNGFSPGSFYRTYRFGNGRTDRDPGSERLIAQITDDNAEAFFVESDIYDTLLILTDDYLICANEYIFALEDIRKILIEALRRRCPEGEFSCPDIDGTDRGDDR